jgi:2'-5' RNA ligase
MSNLIRSFIALYPDESAKQHIANFLQCMRARNRAVRWERPDNVHITLKFLGDVESSTLDTIVHDLNARILPEGAITARLDSTGAFPGMRQPRIVWLGFTQQMESLLTLQRAVENVCETHGLERDQKKFTPHVTIGRVRLQSETAGLENDLEACSFQPATVHFSAVHIMESTLTPQGALHRERARIALTPGE